MMYNIKNKRSIPVNAQNHIDNNEKKKVKNRSRHTGIQILEIVNKDLIISMIHIFKTGKNKDENFEEIVIYEIKNQCTFCN